jgi:hypothetical protein
LSQHSERATEHKIGRKDTYKSNGWNSGNGFSQFHLINQPGEKKKVVNFRWKLEEKFYVVLPPASKPINNTLISAVG